MNSEMAYCNRAINFDSHLKTALTLARSCKDVYAKRQTGIDRLLLVIKTRKLFYSTLSRLSKEARHEQTSNNFERFSAKRKFQSDVRVLFFPVYDPNVWFSLATQAQDQA